jgi:hypothetical protein
MRYASTWLRFGPRSYALLAALIAAGAVCAAPAAQACGYHNPQTLALGMLNWTFPDALYVRTAVWQAEHSGVLPAREAQQVRDPFAYLKLVTHLKKLGARLSRVEGDAEPVSFAAILLESMLWVRFTATADGYVVRPHVDGPEIGDVVIVTDEKVIRALAEGLLGAEQAEAHGLFRLYRQPELHDRVRRVLMAASFLPGSAVLMDVKQ